MNTMKLWIAKDKNAVQCRLFSNKPTRFDDRWIDGPNAHEPAFLLDQKMYPFLKWEDEPFPVELHELGLPSVDAIENVLTCIAEYYADVFRNGVQPEESRREQAQKIQEYIRMYYDYWLPMNERGVVLTRGKHDAQDDEEVQEMQSERSLKTEITSWTDEYNGKTYYALRVYEEGYLQWQSEPCMDEESALKQIEKYKKEKQHHFHF